MSEKVEYDLLVIGGGSGGIAAANRAASYGRRCAVFEESRIGGTCVNAGCVPKKVMWYGAQLAQALEDAVDYGFTIPQTSFDWATLVTNRQAFIERLHGSYRRTLERNGVEYIKNRARITAPGVVEADGRSYRAEHIIIASGGYPRIPEETEIPGANFGITSDGFFELRQQPASVVIVGAGYVAVEFAGMLAALGTKVTLLMRGNRPIRAFDAMLQDNLLQAMRDQGIDVREHCLVHAVSKKNEGIEVTTDKNDRLIAETLIWAVGRAANTTGFGLENAGVALDVNGYVATDDFQNTSAKGIYAIGDVTGRLALTPVAIAAGRRLADRLFNNMPDRRLDYELIPTVLFTHPPIGTVGLSEEQARARYGDAVRVYNRTFTAMQYAFTRHKPPTAMKLIVQGEDEKIVGCHIIGAGADEILQGFAVAIRMGARKRDFDDTVAIHPTAAEELVTMR